MSARKRNPRPRYMYVLSYRGTVIRSNVPSMLEDEMIVTGKRAPVSRRRKVVSDNGPRITFANGGYVNVDTKDRQLDDCEIVFSDGTKVFAPRTLPRLAA